MSTFKTLWNAFPKDDSIKDICFNKQSGSLKSNEPFDNYCSIKLSECFTQGGVSLSGCGCDTCWSHKGAKHVLRAEDFAAWLAKRPPAGFGNKESITPGSFQEKLKGRNGVVFFRDYWQRANQSFPNRTGDHIDLWKSNRISGSSMFVRSLSELLGFVSDLNNSKEIWFWEVD